VVSCLFFILPLSAQLLGEHYIYGCENCVVTDFKVIGENKILFDFTKHNKRKLILLNEENIKVDEIRVGGPTSISTLSPRRFSVAELDAAVEIAIEDHQFVVDSYLSYRYEFANMYGLSYPLSNGTYNIGIGSYTDNGPHYFSFFPLDQKAMIQFLIGRSKDDYNMKGDTVRVLSGKAAFNQDLISYKFINGDQSLADEITSQPATWVDYSVKGDTVTIFSGHLQRLFKVQVADNNPRVISEFKLPAKKQALHGWHYFNDYQANKDYFLLPAADDDTNHELLVLDDKKLIKVAEVPFIPVDIEDGIIYQLKRAEKSCDIYGYPLEKNKNKIMQYDIRGN